MAINGGVGPDDLEGTSGADTINGFGGNDTIDGKGGQDTIDAGGGDDTLLATVNSQSFTTLTGGTGFDKLVLKPSDNPFILTDGTALTQFSVAYTGMDGIEAIEFQSALGTAINLLVRIDGSSIPAGAFTPSFPGQITGGAGFDRVAFLVTGGMGSASELVIPTIAPTSWSAGTDPLLLEDLVNIVASGPANYFIRASEANGAAGIAQGLYGGLGNDTLIGSSGRDILSGGGGMDQVTAGAGDDLLYVADSDGDFGIGDGGSYDGGEGIDWLRILTSMNNDGYGAFQGTLSGVEGLHFAGARNPWTGQIDPTMPMGISFSEANAAIISGNFRFAGNGTVSVNNVASFDPSAFQYLDGAQISFNIDGNDDANVLIGTDDGEEIDGDGGADTIDGRGGDDDIRAGTGRDTVDGGAGDDFIDGEAGNDTLRGGEGDDEIRDQFGNNFIDGGAGNDEISNGSGDDSLHGGEGVDWLNFRGLTGVAVDLSVTTAQAAGSAGTDTFSGFENIDGTAGNDVLSGDGGNNLIIGGLGDDVLKGGLGIDTLSYQAADYSGRGHGVVIKLYQTTAQDTVFDGIDTVSGFENVIGSRWSDEISGTSQDNHLDGGWGWDLLNGGAGNDILDGGDDLFGDERDTASYIGAGTAVRVNLSLTGPQNTLGAGIDTLISIEGVIGSRFDDLLIGSARGDTLNGGRGADIMRGGDGSDIYYIDNVGDRIVDTAAGGLNSVFTTLSYRMSDMMIDLTLIGWDDTRGIGNDYGNRIQGNAGDNVLDGRGGNDYLLGGRGNDIYYLDAGDDFKEFVGGGIDEIRTQRDIHINEISHIENVTLLGTTDAYVIGNERRNVIIGNSGDNSISPGDGNDLVRGMGGNDELFCWSGHDHLIGGLGADSLTGGYGADRFIYEKVADSRGAYRDTITDFSRAEHDKIDLSAIDAISGGSDDGFTVVNAFSESAGELVIRALGAGNYLVLGDVDGDGLANIAIQVASTTQLVWSDFIL